MRKITIQSKQLTYLQPGQQPIIRVTPVAYNSLVDLANESGRSINKVASMIIEQAIENDLIRFERSDAAKETE